MHDDHNANRPAHTLNRREFLWMSLVAAAVAGTWEHGFAVTPAGSTRVVKRYGGLEELPIGAVRPEGWLRTWLGKQASELGSQLPEISWPFTEPYWSGLEQGESWWPWEQKAYWVDGATRLAIVMQDEALMRKVGDVLQYTLAHQDADGYLGPQFFKDPVGDEHRWPQNVFFRGLTASADAQPDTRRIADAMRRHYLNDPADYALPERNITNLESIVWCYEQTGDPKLLALAEGAWARYLAQIADEPNHGDLSEQRVYANTPIRAHGVTYAEVSKLPAILYNVTGKPEYLRFALAAQQRVFTHHMLVDGVPSTSEWYRTRTAIDSHETCCIVDHTWTWGSMLQATGDGLWGDRIERACFNAGPGAIKNDWKALQYFSCPNQFVATLRSDHNVMEHGGSFMAYQPNPGKRTACCGGNVHRLYPNYVARMWMRDGHGGLAATLYGPSTLRTTVGEQATPVVIEQKTGYPFDETITLTFRGEKAVSFPLSLRIPGWCHAPHLQVNGKTTPVTAKLGFVTLTRRFEPGDTLVLTLPMRLATTRWPDNGIAVEHGPLVFALPIHEKWTPVVEPRFTTEAFPSFNAEPVSDWNYGLLIGKGPLESQLQVLRSTVTDDPWSHPPLHITAKGRKIAGYELQGHTNMEGQDFTPPLPDLSTSSISSKVEKLTLVPYGCTHLRATIFPDLAAAPAPAQQAYDGREDTPVTLSGSVFSTLPPSSTT